MSSSNYNGKRSYECNNSAIFLNTKKTLPPCHFVEAFENFYLKDFLTKPWREEIFSKTLSFDR